MVKVTVFASIAALATAISATQNFKKACVAPYDICGWTLTNEEFGYVDFLLQDATWDAGQDPSNGTIVYDSIYNCQDDGVIVWNHHCDDGCDGAIWVPNASCRE